MTSDSLRRVSASVFLLLAAAPLAAHAASAKTPVLRWGGDSAGGAP